MGRELPRLEHPFSLCSRSMIGYALEKVLDGVLS